MKGIVLCEGFDDLFIIGYYLHKTSSNRWNFSPDIKISDSNYYDLPKVNYRNERIELYAKDNEKLAIWCVGGKDRFDKALSYIYKMNTSFPQDRFDKIVVLSDRDEDDVDTCVSKLNDKISQLGWSISLTNNFHNNFQFMVEDENYDVSITPIIIPFDETGALETILMNAIAELGAPEKYIYGQAKKYISEIIQSGKAINYLKHTRERLKAEFSSIISVTNPDRSTTLFNTLLMSHDWETRDSVKRHFHALEELFCVDNT